MTKTLVTGGAGFIGSHTSRALLSQGDEVVIVDNFNDYYNPGIKEKNVEDLVANGAELHRLDIRDQEGVAKLVALTKPDKIVHIAARAGVRPSIQDPLLYEQVNVGGTVNLLEAARASEVPHFVFASSSSVYGNSDKIPFSEDQPVDNPISPYAATKRAGEMFCENYSRLFGLQTTCLRFFTVYGPSGRPDMAPYLFTKAISAGRPIKRFGDGSTKRDYTFISDIVAGVVAATENPFPFEIINLGNHQTVSLTEFITTIEDILGKKAVIEQHPKQPGDVDMTYANIDKAKRLLNYDPKTNIKQGMSKFIEWYLNEAPKD
jgi:UDP-glucuronate 4-epimerase